MGKNVKTKRRNKILSAGKIIIAAALLVWVLSGVHWSDFVETKDTAKTYAIVKIDGQQVHVREGWFFNAKPREFPLEQIKPIPQSDQIRRRGFASTIRNIKIILVIPAIAGFGLCYLVISVRWWFLLRIQEIHISVWEAIRLTFLGLFFNAVVPGTVGGDLVKAYYVAKHTPRKAAVLVSIFVDRVLGLAELTLLAGVMLAVTALIGGSQASGAVSKAAPFVAIALAAVIFMLTFLLSSRFRKLIHLQKLYSRLPIAHHIEAAGDAASLYRKRIGSLVKAIAITFGAHIIWVGSIALLGMSMSLSTSWYMYFLYIPLIYIVGAVPLTPGGLGLIERLYVIFFATQGCSPSSILALALLARLIPILWSLPGAWVAVTGARLPRAEVIEAELGIDDDQADDIAH